MYCPLYCLLFVFLPIMLALVSVSPHLPQFLTGAADFIGTMAIALQCASFPISAVGMACRTWFGLKLKKFWSRHRAEIVAEAPDPLMGEWFQDFVVTRVDRESLTLRRHWIVQFVWFGVAVVTALGAEIMLSILIQFLQLGVPMIAPGLLVLLVAGILFKVSRFEPVVEWGVKSIETGPVLYRVFRRNLVFAREDRLTADALRSISKQVAGLTVTTSGDRFILFITEFHGYQELKMDRVTRALKVRLQRQS